MTSLILCPFQNISLRNEWCLISLTSIYYNHTTTSDSKFNYDNLLLPVYVLTLAKRKILIINILFTSLVHFIAYSLLYWKMQELPVRLLCPLTGFC